MVFKKKRKATKSTAWFANEVTITFIISKTIIAVTKW